MEVQEEDEGNGASTLPLEPRRHELLATSVREGETPATTVSIHMNFESSCERFLQSAPPPSDGGARSSEGCTAVASFNLLTPQSIMGLTSVGVTGAVPQSVTHICTYTQVCVLPRSKSNTWRTDSTFIVIIVYKT